MNLLWSQFILEWLELPYYIISMLLKQIIKTKLERFVESIETVSIWFWIKYYQGVYIHLEYYYIFLTLIAYEFLQKAKQIIEKCLSVLDNNSECVTYLNGKSGIYVTATEIYREIGDLNNAKKMIEK